VLALIAQLADSPRREGGVLDVPFEEYAEACLTEGVADLLRSYARAHRDSTLRHVLKDDRFRRWVQVSKRTTLWLELESELAIVQGVVEEEDGILDEVGTPAALSQPSVAGELVAWAEAVGITARLRDSATVLASLVPSGPLRSVVRDLRRATVRDVLEGTFDSGRWRLGALERGALASYAKAYVQEAVERALADKRDAERVAALAYVPPGEGVGEFVAAVDAALARNTRPPSTRITFTEWRLLREPVRLAASAGIPSKKAARARPATMTIALEDWRAMPLNSAIVCDAKDGRTADATQAFLVAVRRVLGDPENAAHARLVEFLNQAAWARVLANVAAVSPAKTERSEARALPSVGWMITADRQPRVYAVVRHSDRGRDVVEDLSIGGVANGQFEFASDLDERVASALFVKLPVYDYRSYSIGNGFGGLTPDERRERTYHALSLLAGHPRVLGRDGEPLRVVDGPIEVAIEGTDEAGYRLVFRVRGEPIEAHAIRAGLDERGFLIHVDSLRRLVAIAYVGSRRARLLLALASEAATFPASARGPLVARVVALAEVLPIALPPALVGEVLESDARPLVRVVRTATDALALTWLVRPLAGGPALAAGVGSPQLLQEVSGRTAVANRSFEEEHLRAAAIKARLPQSVQDHEALRCEGIRDVLLTIAALRAAAEAGEVVVEWPKNLPRVVGQADWSKLHLHVTQQRDWFGVNGALEIDGESITLDELLRARRSGDPFIVIGPDRLVVLEDELRARLEELEAIARPVKNGLALHRTAAPALAALAAAPEQLDAAPSFWTLLERIDAATANEPKLPRGFGKVLRSYQVEGYRWMSRLAAWGAGACLADEMGLGKTVQTLALLSARAKDGPALVVAPTSVGPNWIAEAKRFAPSLTPILHRGADREAALRTIGPGSLLITSYDLLSRDMDDLAKIDFATVVLDEAQAIKNGVTARARAARSLRADVRLALTGTPVENRLAELYSLMEFLNPDFFGSEEQFRERWVLPIERDKDAARSAALARVIRPFVLRRLKADVLTELPARTDVVRTIERSLPERRLYEAARQLALAAIANADEEARFRVLAEIMRLRRLACHPRLDDDSSKVESSKLVAFLELVTELREGGHRALVFSQFTGHLALVQEALKARGVTYLYLDGKTPLAERTKRVQAFQDGNADLFLISLKAGGTGLNLTAADTVIHLDPWWNPAVEDQASDRAHRMGQKRPVTVIRLIAQGTIEEAVVALHADKRKLAESVLDGTAASGKLSITELGSLIRDAGT